MAMFDSPNMLCSLSSRSIVDKYLSLRVVCWARLFSDSLLHCELVDDVGERDGELKSKMCA